MIGVFLPAFRPVERALADFAPRRRRSLAWASKGRRNRAAVQDVGNTQPASLRRDQTPSPSGRRHAAALPLPASFMLVCAWGKRYGSVTKTGGAEPGQKPCVNPVQKSIEGAGPCLSVHISSPLLPVAALPPVATRWANKRLPVVPSAPVRQPSPAAALRKVQPLVRQAISPIASLTPAAADLTAPPADATARRPDTVSHPRTGMPVAGLSAFIQRPRRIPHVQ